MLQFDWCLDSCSFTTTTDHTAPFYVGSGYMPAGLDFIMPHDTPILYKSVSDLTIYSCWWFMLHAAWSSGEAEQPGGELPQ